MLAQQIFFFSFYYMNVTRVVRSKLVPSLTKLFIIPRSANPPLELDLPSASRVHYISYN
jgi:hypothetical protein